MEKFAQKQPSCVAYEEKMHVYTSVSVEISSNSMSREVWFALLHMEPLARALQDNARCWVTSLGKLLNESAKESLMELKTELDVSADVVLLIHEIVNIRLSPTISSELMYVL